MRLSMTALGAALLWSAVLARAQGPLSDSDVEAAIAAGMKGAPRPIGCFADVKFAEAISSDFGRGYSVALFGPRQNIANKAAEARRKYLGFSKDDVSADMKEPVVTAVVQPDAPKFINRRWQRAAPATHLVIREPAPAPKQEPAIVQPIKVETFPTEWSNSFGLKIPGQGLIAVFNHETFARSRNLDLVVITDARERDCTLKKEALANVR